MQPAALVWLCSVLALGAQNSAADYDNRLEKAVSCYAEKQFVSAGKE